MDSSRSLTAQIDQEGCIRMAKMCCEPLAKLWFVGCIDRTVIPEEFPVIVGLVEACHSSLITCWAGEHHSYLWKLGIEKVLLDLVLENFQKNSTQHLLSVEEQISMAQKGLNANFLLVLGPYVWDILGWLATHCEEDFNLNMH